MHHRILSFLIFLFLLINTSYAQISSVTVSGTIRAQASKEHLPYVTITLSTASDNKFVSGTVSDEQGRFTLSHIKPGNYQLSISLVGYKNQQQNLYVGSLSEYLDVANINLESDEHMLDEVTVTGQQSGISQKMDKKTFTVADNLSQTGGSILQALQNVPGVSTQEGKVQLRGSDKVAILIDGKQTAMTGFGSQTGLDNIPASAIERIEIINNPSSRYDANGNAGIINIIMKKEKKEGLNGKIGLTTGAGALWVRQANLPTIRPQYTFTPKINPSLFLNYRKNKVNAFLSVDNLYTHTLNKNEFVDRVYDDGTTIRQQTKRNRNTNYFTSRMGLDWTINEQNTLTVSGLFGSEKIIDRGDEPFFNADLSERLRLWQFLEDELKTTVMATANYQHKFKEAGHTLNVGLNYTFHREDEKYFFDNIMPDYTGKDAFKLISDEQVMDLNIDYVRPLKYGRIEGGLKFRHRRIPTDMLFIPGLHSPLDSNAGGWATYREIIPAAYGNYIFENEKIEAEIGLRMEYVDLKYDVNPLHPTYKSDGYNYTQPFPNVRLAYKINPQNKFSLFYNRRVDRPNEVDIRIFPKYDDAEIIKVGNPALRPQFTNSFELGYRSDWTKGYIYTALYHRFADGTISRISTTVPGSNLIYAIFQNAGRSYNSGLEAMFHQKFSDTYTLDINGNMYRNQINAFTVENLYPVTHSFHADEQRMFSGTLKINNNFQFPKGLDAQLTAIYLAPDIIPQGKIQSRFSIDLGLKKAVQKGKGELFLNASDLLNTMVIKKTIEGNTFYYTTKDYYETQVVRLGYSYKF